MNEGQEKFDNSMLSADEDSGKSINLADFFKLCLANWYWFAISIFVCLAFATLSVMRTTPTYQRTAMIQIRDDKHGGSLNNEFANSFADLGVFSSSADIYNELLAIKSPRLIAQVVDNLDLNVNYSVKSGLKQLPVYGSNLPFIAEFFEVDGNSYSMEIKVDENGNNAKLTDFVEFVPGGGEVKHEVEIPFQTVAIDTVSTPIGKIVMRPNAKFDGEMPGNGNIRVTYSSPQAATEYMLQSIKSELADQHATVIKLSIIDSSPRRAEDILNNLIEVYNQSWVDDKNQMARATSRFINQRLVGLEDELSDVDSDISSYKSENLVPDVDQASSLYLQQATKTGDEIIELNNKLSMAQYIRDYMMNPNHVASLMPANSGTGENAIDNQISEYNTIMLERNNLAASSSDNHPRVYQYDMSLGEMRKAVLASIDNQIVSLNTAINNLRRSQASATARIAANPTQAKYLMSIGRQQKVKEALYLYLLQKREENELSQTFAPYNTRLLQDAQGSRVAVAPRRSVILFTAFIIGLLIPMAVLYLYEMFNTKVRSRKDLEDLTLPFVGEIPEVGKRKSRKHTDKLGVVVAHGKNDAVNEAFRMLRSNLEFMSRNETVGEGKVIMVTSAIPGSGKTFVTMNLAATIALKGKRVLIVDLDLRRHTMSQLFSPHNRQGITGYLAGNTPVNSIVVKNINDVEGLDFVPAGSVPPNPSELVGDERLKTFIDSMRSLYDVILIDCPPTEAVADSSVISRYTDMTIYVVRVGNLDRAFLPSIERMYRENRFQRMCVLLNGAPVTGAYANRYSYTYSYSTDKAN
ncbi:MAG: polysaccharide biosynthesis tyrosine autokinase [Clostridiales bacterium]|nr:polysaccharide biosynthesis tyrosine autokinase [Clostridiales bacterium]